MISEEGIRTGDNLEEGVSGHTLGSGREGDVSRSGMGAVRCVAQVLPILPAPHHELLQGASTWLHVGIAWGAQKAADARTTPSQLGWNLWVVGRRHQFALRTLGDSRAAELQRTVIT